MISCKAGRPGGETPSRLSINILCGVVGRHPGYKLTLLFETTGMLDQGQSIIFVRRTGTVNSCIHPVLCGARTLSGKIIFTLEDSSLAVSNLDMHALFVLGDLRAKLVKQFQSRFVYVTEQTAEGIYIAEIDTETALVVDDKPRLELKVGDHFRAAVLPSREGGKFELKFRDIKLTVYGLGDYAYVNTPDGHGIVFKEGHAVVTVFAANEQLQGTLSKTLKAVTGKAAKWRKGELTFKASE